MDKYINKAAAIVEIERRIESCAKQRKDMLNVQCYTLADDASARMGELNCIKDFIDTLEVKEELTNDAFIEKVWDWIEDNILSSNQQDKSRLYYKQFKNYMKGE